MSTQSDTEERAGERERNGEGDERQGRAWGARDRYDYIYNNNVCQRPTYFYVLLLDWYIVNKSEAIPIFLIRNVRLTMESSVIPFTLDLFNLQI